MEHALARINTHLEDNSVYPHTIIGFRPHLSTQDAMLQLKHQVLNDRSRDTKAILGLDLTQAFDSISHEAILDQVSHLHLGERSYNYIRDFICNPTATLSAGDLRSDQLPLGSKGTPQGSVISPMLFNLVMIGLAQQFQRVTISTIPSTPITSPSGRTEAVMVKWSQPSKRRLTRFKPNSKEPDCAVAG